MVGGLSGFDEQSVLRGKTYRQFKEHMLTSLYERKNRRKSRSKRSRAGDLDVTARKIKKLKNNDTQLKFRVIVHIVLVCMNLEHRTAQLFYNVGRK